MTAAASIPGARSTQTVLRVALNTGNRALVQLGEGGTFAGIACDVGGALARFVGKTASFLSYDSADEILRHCDKESWDIALLAIDRSRNHLVAFSDPYMTTEATCLVRADSPFRSVEDLDQPGVMISATRNAAYAHALRARLKLATIVEAATAAEALKTFDENSLDAVAGIRAALLSRAHERPELRVLDRSFETIPQAIAVPKTLTSLLPLINRFVAEWLASGAGAMAPGRTRAVGGQRDPMAFER